MINLSKKAALLGIVSIAVLAVGIHWRVQKTSSKPNVILIILDAARPDHFSCYGYGKQTTPAIDEIAREGAIFLNHFALSTNTYGSLPQLFSSRYLSKGIFEFDGWLWGAKRTSPLLLMRDFDPGQIMLQQALSLQGYKTAIFTQHPSHTEQTLLVKSFEEYHAIELDPAAFASDKHNPLTDWISKNRHDPFFLYLHAMSPHEPYPKTLEKKEFLLDRNGKPFTESQIGETRDKLASYAPISLTEAGFTDTDILCLQGLYDCNLNHADGIVGAIYAQLKESGLIKKTIIIITSDHGECLGEHGKFGHSPPPWDEIIKIPLIMSYPRSIPNALRYEGFTESIDIMPTILGLCGITLPPHKTMDGDNIMQMIKHGKRKKETVYIINAIRTNKYKYILNSASLFDISRDPDESRNIFFEEPFIADKLQKQYVKKITPYFQRFKNAVKEGQPDEPFLFTMSSFDISSVNPGAESVTDIPRIATIKDNRSISRNAYILALPNSVIDTLFMPGSGEPSTLNLSTSIPPGAYTVYLLCCSSRDIRNDDSGISLRYRFTPEGPYHTPEYVPLDVPDSALDNTMPFYYYLKLRNKYISGGRLWFQISYRAPADTRTAVIHAKFYPGDSNNKKDPAIINRDFEHRSKTLKSLGYM